MVIAMKLILFPAVLLVTGLVQAILADPQQEEQGKLLTGIEQKLLGAWTGQTGCAGSFLFRVDGTYELTGYGPAPYDSAGTWKVRCDARPATLVLTCRESEAPEEVGKTTDVEIVQFDGGQLAIKRANQEAERYARVKD
jgi:hypothetical protein